MRGELTGISTQNNSILTLIFNDKSHSAAQAILKFTKVPKKGHKLR